jgi:hypothetical protein
LGAHHVDQQDAEQVIRGESHDDDDDDDDEYSYDDDDDDYDSCNDDGAIEENDLLSRCGLKVTDSSHLAICLTSNSSISNFSAAQSCRACRNFE